MAKLGSPKTTKFSIGSAELRIGPMSLANKLTQSHSIGLVDSVTVEVAQETVDLKGGNPKILLDTAIIDQTTSISATIREYSQRNLQVMMGAGVNTTAQSDTFSTADADTTAGAITVSVAAADPAGQTAFAVGDIVIIYPQGRPEEVSVVRLSAVDAVGDNLTLDAGTPTLFNYAGTTETIHVVKAAQTAVGKVEVASYFAVQVLQEERATGRPMGFSFWKATIDSGLSITNSEDDFASTDMSIKLLVPAASEYNASGDTLWHLKDVIPNHPTGMHFIGADG